MSFCCFVDADTAPRETLLERVMDQYATIDWNLVFNIMHLGTDLRFNFQPLFSRVSDTMPRVARINKFSMQLQPIRLIRSSFLPLATFSRRPLDLAKWCCVFGLVEVLEQLCLGGELGLTCKALKLGARCLHP